MPKANIVLADGTKVMVEGTPDEVAAVLQRITANVSSPPALNASRTPRKKAAARSTSSKAPPKGPADYIRALAADDFFKTKRGLADVQKKLEEGAHIYPVTHLSPALFRLVRSKELRRIKEGGTWKYVNP